MKYLLLTLLMVVIYFSSEARSFRVSQIPNGNVNRCANCHLNTAGGGPLTPFGIEVSNNFLKNGDVVWNSTLASIDSDGDGFTNGQELQDPNGTWRIGNNNPGESSLVSNPGNANSIPNVSSVQEFALKSGLYLISLFPNPIISEANLYFSINISGKVEIELINSLGMSMFSLSKQVDIGENLINLNFKKSLSNGVYFLKINFNGFTHFEKIIISK